MNNEKMIARPLLRIGAYLIDRLLYVVIVLTVLAWAVNTNEPTRLLDNLFAFLIFYLLGMQILWWFLLSWMESMFGGTPGKLIIGTRVVDGKNKNLSLKMALFRNYVGKTVSNLLFGLGYLWILKDENRQAWHDMTAGSYVVQKNKYSLLIAVVINIVLVIILALSIQLIFENVSSNADLYWDIGSTLADWLQL